jgi:hypothetical protein
MVRGKWKENATADEEQKGGGKADNIKLYIMTLDMIIIPFQLI